MACACIAASRRPSSPWATRMSWMTVAGLRTLAGCHRRLRMASARSRDSSDRGEPSMAGRGWARVPPAESASCLLGAAGRHRAVLAAQAGLEDLAGGVAGEGVHEDDRLRELVL